MSACKRHLGADTPPSGLGPVTRSGGSAFVMVMQAADFRDFDHLSFCGELHPPGLWRIFVERKMSAPSMVIGEIRFQRSSQGRFTKHDYVVQTFSANRADYPLDIRSLPRTPWRRKHLPDAHSLHLVHEVAPEDPIAISEKITWCAAPRESVSKLLHGPLRSWVSSNAVVQNAPAVVCQDQKYIQDLKADRRHRKEVNGHQAVDVILQKSPPGL